MSNLAQEVQKTAYLQEIARVMNVIAKELTALREAAEKIAQK